MNPEQSALMRILFLLFLLKKITQTSSSILCPWPTQSYQGNLYSGGTKAQVPVGVVWPT